MFLQKSERKLFVTQLLTTRNGLRSGEFLLVRDMRDPRKHCMYIQYLVNGIKNYKQHPRFTNANSKCGDIKTRMLSFSYKHCCYLHNIRCFDILKPVYTLHSDVCTFKNVIKYVIPLFPTLPDNLF